MSSVRAAARGRLEGRLALVPGGRFLMGSKGFYPEEGPVVSVSVDPLFVQVAPVTNAEFEAFVTATGHRTVAERAPLAADFPDADPDLLVPGSLVFTPPPGPVPLDDWTRWWSWVPGATWRCPQGPGSDLGGRADHPVVHVGFEDAVAYATWAGGRLATEPEWEHAARGGLEGAAYAWGSRSASTGGRWRTPSTVSSPGAVPIPTGSSARPQWARTLRTATACST